MRNVVLILAYLSMVVVLGPMCVQCTDDGLWCDAIVEEVPSYLTIVLVFGPMCVQGTDDGLWCDAIGEEGVFSFTVRIPEVVISPPGKSHVYLTFKFPTADADAYHIVASEPRVSNIGALNHMFVYGCYDGDVNETTLNQPWACDFMNPPTGCGCDEMIDSWVAGQRGTCAPEEAGIHVGGLYGYTHGVIQYDLASPIDSETYTDSHGITFYGTKKLRPHDLGVLPIGQAVLTIPPGRNEHAVHGKCDGACLKRHLTKNITIYSALHLMHLLGKSQVTQLRRPSNLTFPIAVDKAYEYGKPVMHRLTESIMLRPGDELSTSCTYDTASLTRTTFYGAGVSDELCHSFLYFYPKENLNINDCVETLGVGTCDWKDQYVDGCDVSVLQNRTHPETAQVHYLVSTYCSPGDCRAECLEYVRHVKRRPCYHGDVHELTRARAVADDPGAVAWYAAFDSCDVELMGEC